MIQTSAVRHRFTTGAAGNRLHYLDFGGSGSSLVLIHGVTGNAWNWYRIAEGLTRVRRVLALDLRGYGESQWSAEHEYRTVDHAADLTAIAEALGGGPIDLMGSSWGALIAIQLASERPDLVSSLVVVDVEASFEQSETDLFPRPTHYVDHEAVVKAEADRNPHATPEMLAVIAATCYGPGPAGSLVPKHDPFFFERWPFRSDDHWARLETINAPTLLVHAADSFVRREVMTKMAERVLNSTLVELADSGHAVPIENPGGLVQAVMPFLE